MQQVQLKQQQCGSGGEGETCRFPKLQECAHFHYERVNLGPLQISLQPNNGDVSHHSLQHSFRYEDKNEDEFYTVQVTSNNECWLLQRSVENFIMLDSQLHQCIFDRKVSLLPEITPELTPDTAELVLTDYLERFCQIADNSLNCGPVLTWFQLDNRGHRLLVPNEESDSINTPAVAAAYSIKKYISQARDELNLEVGDMISVIDMASPGESMWWRGKRGFQVGFFPQHCVHVIGEKVACLPHAPNAIGTSGGTISPIKPVLRKHGKLIAFFRSFILNRPSRRRLKQSGILRERVFGCDLGEHLLNSGNDIPMVLKCCAEFIETHGIVDGIYRLSGVTSNIQKLRNAFDEDRIPNLLTEDILQDIHSVASLLKMYFRELPNPLCTYQLYHSFVNAVQGTQINSSGVRSKLDESQRLLRMRETVHKLPPPHYRTLEYLMRHLARVAKHGSNTGMTSRNVAIVWAPNLLRCAELEVGGVAALQGVGVQAVVTEFLVCYTDLIFCDFLNQDDSSLAADQQPSSLSPKKLRPKSLAISTPTKLLSLEEARSKHLISKSDDNSYIEVGGGPKNLPEKYHTVLELPQGFRKRTTSKRSPLGWRSFFTKSRNNSHTNLTKPTIKKALTPGVTTSFQEKSVTESELSEIRRKLRPVKSAESLTSGQSEPPTNEIDTLGPLHCLNKPSGHNRSISHDSYFDTLQASNNNSEGSLLDLSEIQLNFELEESEMRIFSEDESLVSSPRVNKEVTSRKLLSRARQEDFSSTTNSSNPSPKKQARVVLSPESQSRKRSRLEDQLSDILYIDCNTPEHTICTTAMIHTFPDRPSNKHSIDEVEPKNKSPRNSDVNVGLALDSPEAVASVEIKDKYKYTGSTKLPKNNRKSLNLESCQRMEPMLPKSLTEFDISRNLQVPLEVSSGVSSTNLSPQTPNYNRLIGETDSSETTTPNQISPDYSLTESPTEISYKHLNRISVESQKFNEGDDEKKNMSTSNTYESMTNDIIENLSPKKSPASPSYENVLTTISITYHLNSPSKNKPFDVAVNKDSNIYEDVDVNAEMKAVIPTSTANLPVSQASQPDTKVASIEKVIVPHETPTSVSPDDHRTTTPTTSPLKPTFLTLVDSNHSFDSSVNNYQSPIRPISLSFQANHPLNLLPISPTYENIEHKAASLNKDKQSSSVLFPLSDPCSPIRPLSVNEKRKSCETEDVHDGDAIYQQVKYFRRSIHEINELLDKPLVVVDAVEDVKYVNNINYDVPDVSSENLPRVVEQVCMPAPCAVECNREISTDLFPETLEYEEQCKISELISSETDTDNLESMSDRFDSLEPDGDIHTRLADLEASPLPTVPDVDDVLIAAVGVVDPVIEPVNSIHDKKKRRSRTESVKEIANKFENFDSYEHVNNQKFQDRGSLDRDSLPPCLRARYAKLSKNTPKARSLDEIEFVKEFGSKSTVTCWSNTVSQSSIARRKSLDERLSRFSSAQPKFLNLPKSLPDGAKKSPDFHSTHSLPSTKRKTLMNSPPSLSLNDITDGRKEEPILCLKFDLPLQPTKASQTAQVNTAAVLSTIINTTTSNEEQKFPNMNSFGTDASVLSTQHHRATSDLSDNPQLNRERIEKYKEERRNFLREKYRSESFRAEKDQVLTRLKQKIKPRIDSDEKDEIMKDSLEYTDVIDIANKIDSHDTFVRQYHRVENNAVSERNKNDGCLDTNRYKSCSDKADIGSVPLHDATRFSEMYDSQLSQRLLKNDVIDLGNATLRKTDDNESKANFPWRRNCNDTSLKIVDTIPVKREPGKDWESDLMGVRKKDYLECSTGSKDIKLMSRDYVATGNDSRRYTFDTSREKETESEKSVRLSLESRAIAHNTKKEKRSPSYCIKDMTAMFESKSNQS